MKDLQLKDKIEIAAEQIEQSDEVGCLTSQQLRHILTNFADNLVKNISYEPVLGVVSKYEIDFGNYCRAGIDIQNNKPTVIGAINGWGDGISLDEINIKDLNKQ